MLVRMWSEHKNPGIFAPCIFEKKNILFKIYVNFENLVDNIMAYMSKLDIRSLIEGYLFVDICGLPLYRGSGLK